MTASQMSLFDLGRQRLQDVSIERRLEAAAVVLEAGELSVDDRRRLLLLVVAPHVFAEVQR